MSDGYPFVKAVEQTQALKKFVFAAMGVERVEYNIDNTTAINLKTS